ncbi:trypsin-like serine peptidase [Roseiconus lacunae]|uniref:trypsin-like serine peptidase n=1 Tax=Roseiconus lacunae TaxID=2605694 RepID=UPI001E60AED9|nr:trypsin-like serine protease [Roseiconus lacunae]MCD0459975.1 trypsin-like serine protease [Roseiconus lacunae]
MHESVAFEPAGIPVGECLRDSLVAEGDSLQVLSGEMLPPFSDSPLDMESTSYPLSDEFDTAPNAWFAVNGDMALGYQLANLTEELSVERIFGPDDRKQVHETTRHPFSCLCALDILAPNNQKFVGTGWLIDSQTVVTAGHCVYMKKLGGWAKAIDVYPGRNGSRVYHRAAAKRLISVRGWTEKRSPPSDYAAIKLTEPLDEAGTMGFGVMKEDKLRKFRFHVVGYPGDKPRTMWGHVRKLKDVTEDQLIYETDTFGGNSGGPVFAVDGGKVWSVGIHNYGDISGNLATRITKPVYDNFMRWMG